MIATPMIPAPGVSSSLTPVAGIDLLTRSEREADHLALGISADLIAHGATEVTIATHWAQVGLLRHVALSVQLSDTAAVECGAVQAVLADVATRHDGPFGLLLSHYYRGEPELTQVLTRTAEAHTARTSGRVVVFPGSVGLVGTLSVGHVITASAIDRVQILTGHEAEHTTALATRDFLRPRWDAGYLVLHVQPAAGATLVPFETPTPTPCCADHA